MPDEMTPFAELRMSGARFDAGVLPLGSLVELVAYRDLVVEVAKHVWRQENPARRRLPNGFDEELGLSLRRIEAGSAMPVLERRTDNERLPLGDVFDRARDLIALAVSTTAQETDLPDEFPKDALPFFDRFGRGLRDDESIELRSPSAMSGPSYTQRVRRRLVLGRQESYLGEALAVGRVAELDGEKQRFNLRTDLGSLLSVPVMDSSMFEIVKNDLSLGGEGPLIRVAGVGSFDRNDKLLSFDSVSEFMDADKDEELTLARGLAAVAELQSGWLDGSGNSPEERVVERARSLFNGLLLYSVPAPRVYPVPNGGIQAEWTFGEREVSVAVEPGGSLYLIAVDVTSGQSEDATLNSDDVGAVARFIGS